MGRYPRQEKLRVSTLGKMREIDVMNDYLLTKENCDLEKIVVWS
jgi:hypothetical protein